MCITACGTGHDNYLSTFIYKTNAVFLAQLYIFRSEKCYLDTFMNLILSSVNVYIIKLFVLRL